MPVISNLYLDCGFAEECETSQLVAAPQNGGRVFAMRHGVRKARLGRPADQRKALVRNLTTEVLRHGKITTTKVWFLCNISGSISSNTQVYVPYL